MNNPILPWNWPRGGRYFLAPATVAAALVCRIALDPFLHDSSPFMYFFVAIIVSGWLGGLGPALTATVLSMFAVDYFYMPPTGTFLLGEPKEIIQIVSFGILGSTVSVIVARVRREKQRAEQAAAAARASETEAREVAEALRQSEERFRTMASAMPQLAWIARADGYIYWYNRGWHEYTGTTPEQMEGWGWQSVHDPEVLPHVLEQWKASIATGEPFEMVFPLRGADGLYRRFLTRGTPLKDSQGRVVQWLGTNTDVDELKRTEEALRRSEERLQATFESAAVGIVETDGQDHLAVVNERICQILGYPREELVGKSVHELTAPEDQSTSDDLNAQLHAGRVKQIEYEKRYLRKDGTLLWAHVTVGAVRDSEGRYLYSIGTIEDINERKAAEEQLKLQAMALDAAANGIIVTDTNGTIQWVNPAFEAMTGYTIDEVVGQNPRILRSGKQDESFYRAMWEAIRRGEKWRGELVNRNKNGELYTEEMVISPVKDERGGISHFIAIMQDISERKRIENQLRDSQRRLTDIIEFLPDSTFALDNDGKIIAWNKAMEELTGTPAQEVMGKGNHEHTYRLYGERIPCLADAVLRGDRVSWSFSNLAKGKDTIRAETYIPLHKPGGVWLSIKVAKIFDARGNVVGVIDSCHDITMRKRAEEALLESERKFRSLFENMQHGSAYCQMLFDDNGSPDDFIYLQVNDAFEKLTGLKNVIGRRVTEVIPGIRETEPELFASYGRVSMTGQPEKFEVLLKSLDQWLSVAVYSPERGYFVAIFDNITHRKQSEQALLRAKEELERRVYERTAQIRALALELTQAEQRERKRLALVLHDNLQQILVGVKMALYSIESQIAENGRQSLEKAAALLDEAIAESRSLAVELSPPIMQTAGLVGAMNWLGRWMGEKYGLDVQVDAGAEITPDSEEVGVLLFQCVRELLFNVVKHSGVKSARVSIEPANSHIQIVVADQGVGFNPARVQARGAGSGFGLFSIRERLLLVGGHMDIESAPSRGTRVALIVPLYAPAEQSE